MSNKNGVNIKPEELESAIAWGIYKGGLSLALVFFILWIFMPFILPLALLGSGYATEKWLEPFVNRVLGISTQGWREIFESTFWLLLIIPVIWTSLYFFSKTKICLKVENWFEYRLTKTDGGSGDWRLIGLAIGLISAFIFTVAAFACVTMPRDFKSDDLILLFVSLLISIGGFYLSLQKHES